MVQTLVQANDCLFQVDIGDGYEDILCFKSFTLNITTDEKETTTVTDGQFKSFDYKVLSYTVNLNGGMRIPDAISPTLFDLVEYQLGFLPVPFRAIWKDPNNNIRTFTGVGIIKTSNLLNNASQLADVTIDMLGTGEFVIGTVIETLVDLTMVMTGDDSAVALVKFKLLNSDGDTIFQSDTLPQANGGNLSNPFNITTQVQSGTYYIYWQVQSNVIGNQVALNAPPTLSQSFNSGTQNYSSFGVQAYDFTAHRTITFTLGVDNPGPTCVVPAIASGLSNDHGTQWQSFSATVTVSGTTPFTISNVTKPSWMTIADQGNGIILLSGLPDSDGTQNISFDITNDCGTVNFSDTIDISSATNPMPVNWSFTEASSGYGFRLWVNGVLVVTRETADSGTITVNGGDTVEAFIVGPILMSKHLKVRETVFNTVLYDSTGGQSFKNFQWITPGIGSRAYEVIAEGLV